MASMTRDGDAQQENPEWAVGPFPWRVTPPEWLCGRLIGLVPGWLYWHWSDAYLWILAKSYTAEVLPELRRQWERDRDFPEAAK